MAATLQLPTPGVPSRDATAIGVGLVVVAVLLGLGLALIGSLAIFALVGLLVVLAIARNPMLGVFAVLVTTPLLAAQERGTFVPGFRAHELVLFAVVAAVGLRLAVLFLSGRSVRIRLCTVDIAFAVVAFAGSVSPVLLNLWRGRPLTTDGIGQLLVFPKYFALYLVIRIAVRSTKHVRLALLTMLTTGAIVALIALVQTAATARVNELFLDLGWEVTEHFFIGKTTSTIGNAILLGMYLSSLFAVAMSLLFHSLQSNGLRSWRHPSTLIAGAATALLGLAGLATAQMSTIIAMACAVIICLLVIRRTYYLGLIPFIGGLALVPLWPVVAKRLEEFEGFNQLPRSWADRVANLQSFFLPELATDDNWIWSVRPETSKLDTNNITGTVFIESGYLAMLWIGGVLLLFAVVAFQVTSLRATWRRVRRSDKWLSAAATGAFVGFFATAVLMLIDSHLTFRASADVLYTLLALSLVPLAPPVEMRAK